MRGVGRTWRLWGGLLGMWIEQRGCCRSWWMEEAGGGRLMATMGVSG